HRPGQQAGAHRLGGVATRRPFRVSSSEHVTPRLATLTPPCGDDDPAVNLLEHRRMARSVGPSVGNKPTVLLAPQAAVNNGLAAPMRVFHPGPELAQLHIPRPKIRVQSHRVCAPPRSRSKLAKGSPAPSGRSSPQGPKCPAEAREVSR